MSLKIDLDKVKADLEVQGWCFLEKTLTPSFCEHLLTLLKTKKSQDEFSLAQVGKDLSQTLERSIRKSQIYWIENWKESEELIEINNFLKSFMTEMNHHFFLSMKRFESQFAFYPEGGFYKKHLDQLKDNYHRQISCIFYLNDCDGGELVLYDRDRKNEIKKTIKPAAGHFVVFFSSQIYHEVLVSSSSRFSLTTWFRDDMTSLISTI